MRRAVSETFGPVAANSAAPAAPATAAAVPDLHRIGGGSAENLRLKPAEALLTPPGISVLRTATPGEAARQVRAAFPKAAKLIEAAGTVGSTTDQAVKDAGFEVRPDPTRRFPNHRRVTQPAGAAGFSDENLKRFSGVFTDTTGH